MCEEGCTDRYREGAEPHRFPPPWSVEANATPAASLRRVLVFVCCPKLNAANNLSE